MGTPSPRVLHRLSGVLDINYWQLMDLAGYVVPGDHARPAVRATAPPVDPLERIAEALEELRDEVKSIKNHLESATAELPPPTEKLLAA